MGEEKLVALIQESLSAATRTSVAKPSDFSKVIVDTTVQPKAVAFLTDTKLMHRARERLVRLAKRHGVALRQSYARVSKRALMAHQRYAHATQFKRANRSKGGQFIAHVKTLPGNPYDGHTLMTVIPQIKTQVGASLARIVALSSGGSLYVRHLLGSQAAALGE
jgi:hypothetical protein